MKRLIVLLMFAPLIGMTQTNRDLTDSSLYYKKQMEKLFKDNLDSLKNSSRYKDLVAAQKYHISYTNNYVAFTMLANLLHSDYSVFNKSITASGFGELSPLSYGAGMGWSTKTGHGLVDFYFATINFGNNTQKGDEKITSSLGNLFQFNFGYDVLHSKAISFYPYAGLSVRMSSLNFEKSGTVNPAFTNISNILQNANIIYATSTRLGYDAGLGLDFVLANSKDRTKATILFAKGGINKPFGRDTYKIEGQMYDPQISKGDWTLSVGLKLATRY